MSNTPSSTSTPTAGSSLLAFVYGLPPLHARLLMLALAAVFTLLVCTVFRGALHTFEERIGALGWRLDPVMQTEERISIIAIDEKSLDQLGPWPWPRETMARLSSALTAAGVQMQLYDIVFPEAKAGDESFIEALQASPAVLAQVPALQSTDNTRTGQLTHPVSGVACTPGAASGTTAGVTLPQAQSYFGNAPGYAPIPKGHITPVRDNDGAVRQMPALICVDGAAYPALPISALLLATGSSSWAVSTTPGTSLLGPAQQLTLTGYPGLSIPLDDAGNMRVSFRSAPEAYRAIPAVDVINGNVDRALIDGTWVVVGYAAFGLMDTVPTPFNGATPGVELQARMIASMLDNDVPYTPAGAPLLLVLLSAAFAGVLLVLACARDRIAGYGLAVCTVLLPFVAILFHAQLLSGSNLWLGWVAPALYSLSAGSLLILHEYARVRLERSRVLSNLSSYLPTDVAQQIAYSLPNSRINARRQDATLLSADLRNFSAYGEARPPEESAALLHYFFVRTTAIVEKHHGRVHEFKGDSLLAIWDGSSSAAASHALQAAQEMQQTIEDVLPQTPPPGLEPLALGIGIEQGPVLIGSIGPAHRRSHTLLGETVTITLRIQDLTDDLAQPILIGECAARQLSDLGLESQGSYLLQGLRIPHTLFAPAPLEPDSKLIKTQATLRLLRGGRH